MSVIKYKSCKQQLLRSLSIGLGLSVLLSGCGTTIPDQEKSGRHLQSSPMAQSQNDISGSIPSVVTAPPLLDAPQPGADTELYTVIAQDIAIRDLLFQLSRDSGINVDVSPNVSGHITLNAIDQSFPQILQRISRQAGIRWFYDESGNVIVEPDSPVWKSYNIDYVNLSRTSSTSSSSSSSIGGGSESSSSLSFSNDFWDTLESNLNSLISVSGSQVATTESSDIVINAESGVVSVRANDSQHQQISAFINSVSTRSLYQVLIEATIVEVNLSDDYQSGVDWSTIGRNNGTINFAQNVTNSALLNPDLTTNILTIDRTATPDAIDATIALLSQFGELRVLSSPKIMALNNQTAQLKVVDNKVYFTIEVEPAVISNGVSTGATFTTSVETVPVGFVMSVTPQISANDQVTLNVRPTITRILQYVQDPNPVLAQNNVINRIPEIQLREFDSILKLYDGQIGILGGLMQDSISTNSDGLPGLSRLPVIRNFFSYRADTSNKSELIIFIRPVIVKQPSLSGDLWDYREYLPASTLESSAVVQPGQLPTIFSQ